MSARFHQAVRRALANPVLQEALDYNAQRRKAGAQQAYESLPEAEAVRQHARSIRQAVLQDWDGLLAGFVEVCQANGLRVLKASSALEACEHVLRIARQHDVHLVAKSKSMVSEEIALNPALERAGLQVVETDLGEYIVQLRGEPPAHIITPALHLRRQEVGRTFSKHLGVPYTDDLSTMTAVARRTLRQVFLTADMGISGVNMAAADTGTLCLVTNEGNGRMVTTLPRVHVALMGIERLVPKLEDLAVILQLLPRNATGQILTSYVTLIQGPGRPQSEDGSEHRYVILVDNGRRRLHGTPLAEALMCIRCGACLNSCPVFQELGGHAYGSPYPGPIGSVVSPALFGVKAFGHLAMASTLCGACKEACPIGIDIPRMLLHLRQEYVSSGSGRRDLRWGLRAFAWAVTHPAGFAFGQRLAGAAAALAPRAAGWLRWLPPPGASWTRSRHFPPFASRTLHRRWRETKALPRATTAGHPAEPPAQASSTPAATARRSSGSLIEGFTQALRAVSGEVFRVPTDGIADALRRLLPADRGPGLAAQNDQSDSQLRRQMEMAGFEFLDIHQPGASNARPIEAASWGMVRARAALADTGTVVLPSIPVGTLVASLLPPTLVVVLQQSDIHADLPSWLAAGGRTLVSESSMVALVTGPSRTSDIEMTMTLGVHGPGRLVVLLTP